jgi:hypothetical protein
MGTAFEYINIVENCVNVEVYKMIFRTKNPSLMLERLNVVSLLAVLLLCAWYVAFFLASRDPLCDQFWDELEVVVC